jgi:N-acetylneuraminic acid mutarotase
MKKACSALCCFIYLASLCIILFTNTGYAQTPQENTWETIQPMPQTKGVYAISVNDKIYLIVADYDSRDSSLLIFDTAKQSWTKSSGLPTFRSAFGLAVIGTKIYTISGQHTENMTNGAIYGYPTNINEVYDTQTDSWETKSPYPDTCGQLTAVAENGKIYLFGADSSSKTYVYDPSTDSYEQKAPSPRSIARCLAASVDDKIYVISDINEYYADNRMQHIGELFIYDTTGNFWSNGQSIPAKYSGSSIVAYTGPQALTRIYVIGGCIIYGIGDMDPVSSNYAYDPATNTWASAANMPTARSGAGLATCNGRIYAIGGATDGGFPRFTGTNIIEVYNPLGYDPSVSIRSSESHETSQSTLQTMAIIAGAVVAGTIITAVIITVYHFKHAPAKAVKP